MKYKNLGKTGLKVSEVCLGTMTFGSTNRGLGDLNLDEAKDLVATAWEAGVNFFDTADVYAGGEAEKILGQAIKDLGIAREKAVIATKVWAPMSNEAAAGTGDVNNKGLSRKHIMESIDASLDRLGTDYIDLYQIHGEDPSTPLEETLSTLNDLVRQGKVHYIGCSNVSVRYLAKAIQISRANGWETFSSLQAYYSVLGRDLEYELAPLCEEEGVGIMTWSPLAGGFLTGKYRRNQAAPEDSRRSSFSFPPVDEELGYDVVEVMDDIAKNKDITVSQVALSWLLHQRSVTSIIVGAKSKAQLLENLKSIHVDLSQEDINRISEITKPKPIYPLWLLQ